MKKLKLSGVFVVATVLCVCAQPTTTPTISSTPPPQAPQSTVFGPSVNDGVYIPEHLPNRKPIPYVPLRESDVIWQHRIWRVIDLREKINHPLYFPTDEVSTKRPSLFSVIKKGITTHELSVYDPNPATFDADEEFKIEFPYSEAQKSFVVEKSSFKQDTATGELTAVTLPDTVKPDDIKQYWIKEDWFFDKQRSIMDVRILGIAPVIETQDDKGGFKGYRPLFWLYYPGCRNWFSKYQCYNPYNDAEWRTFDEVLHKRQFSSYIKEETNVYNRPIVTYAQGVDALLESDRIKDDIFKFEHDMWQY
ncbi:MAG: gliding motility protein GldN [Bacteroidetes bacterium]|nr:gliding motility protein GldN [Bacteroidota bacterium]